MSRLNLIPAAFLSVQVPDVSSRPGRFYEEMSVLCERIDGVTVEMQKDVPHVGVIKTGCQGLCELGPLMRIEPYDYQYVHVQPEDCRGKLWRELYWKGNL